MEKHEATFTSFKGRGFQMTFANGNTVSVMFHSGSHADFDEDGVATSAEIAAWNEPDRKHAKEMDSRSTDYWHCFSDRHSDCVKGRVPLGELVEFFKFAATNKLNVIPNPHREEEEE